MLGKTLTLGLIVICELGILTHQVAAQTFSVQPASSVDLIPGKNAFGQLSCTFSKTSPTDVIGWVVNGVRISNENDKITSAIETALGPDASNKIALVGPQEEQNSNFVYEMDFYTASEVLNGEYKCQLCSDSTCGTMIAESTAAQVRVEYEPTTPLTCLPASVTQVTLGESVTLYCSSDPGVPNVQLEWRRNSQVMSGQSPPVVMGGVLYHNHTFVPEVSDDDPGVTYSCVRTGATSTSSDTCNVRPFILVSTPHVAVIPPSQGIIPGSSGTYSCSATSDTNTPIAEYNWRIPDVDSSRLTISANGRSVTIDSITVADHEKAVQCEVTDAQSMKGSGQYIILVQGEVVPSNLPTVPSVIPTEPPLISTTPVPTSLPSPFPVAAIIAIVVVGFILLCFVFGGIWFFQNKKKQGQHPPPTIVKNDLSPTSASAYAKPYPNYDVKHPDPDVIPKGPNERPVDVDDADWWKGSEAPNDQIPLKQVNIPVQSMGSNARLEDPYKYDPAYDDKADPAELDVKVPLDDGYGDGYDYGYPDGYSKKYNDMRYSEDGFDKQIYSDRIYGDGQQDTYPGYPQSYGDGYNPADTSNYGTMYDDGYNVPTAPHDNGYDQYPDRMPDGSEGYEPPPPEEYNNQAYSGYSAPGDYGRPEDYSGVGDYNQPADYSGQPQDMGYGDVQPAEYDGRPSNYDYQNPSSGAVPDGYNEEAYDDQYSTPYNAERIPDGGAPGDYELYNYPPEGEPYGDGYTNEPAAFDGYNNVQSAYNDGYGNDQSAYNDGYGNDPAAYNGEDGYQPYPDQFDGAGQPQGKQYFDLAEEVSATSNPSYV